MRRFCGRSCLLWTLALALAAPPAAHASEPADEQARLEAIYSAANQATRAGDFPAAAEHFAEVLAVLPESRDTHESRALALLDSVAARRQAHARSGDRLQLCSARDLTREYLVAAERSHGVAARELDGVRQAQHLRDELVAELADATCPGDQPTAEAPPSAPLRLAPAPRPAPDRRVVAGAALLGAGGLCLGLFAAGLGVGARAEARLRDDRTADPARDIDALLADGHIQRGRAGNRLAIAGGVLAAVTLAVGATLLALGKTRPRSTRVALTPGGLGLRF